MTVASTTRRADAVGNGTASVYPFTYRILDDDDLLVSVEDTSGNISTLAKTTDYTVSGVGAYAGGSITLVNSGQAWLDAEGDLKTSYRITVRRRLTITQTTDLRNRGGFYPEDHETAFDRLTMICLQQQDEIDRSLKFPETDDTTLETTLPAASVRASKYAAFDGNGNIIASAGTGADSGLRGDLASLSATLGAVLVGNSVQVVNDLATLRTITGTASRLLLSKHRATAGDLGGGLWKWESGDQSANVSADTQAGLWVAPSSDLTGASGAWRRLYEGRINVRWFGATGDGTTDDATALQAALNAGGDISLPAGTYLIGTTLSMTVRAALVGEGWDSIIKVKNNANTHAFDVKYAGCVLRDLKIDGNKANQTAGSAINVGHTTVDCPDVVIENVWIYNPKVSGIRPNPGATRLRILRNVIEGSGDAAIHADSTVSAGTVQSDCLVDGNVILSPGAQGIFFGTDILRSRIVNNRVYEAPTQGIEVWTRCKYSVISGNTVTATTGGMGISIGGSDNCAVIGNTIQGGTNYAIEVVGDDNVVDGNVIDNPAGVGITVNVSASYPSKRNRISNNHINQTGGYGIAIQGASEVALGTGIIGNTIYTTGNTAIWAGTSGIQAQTSIVGNTIIFPNTGRNGIESVGLGDAIRGNTIVYESAIAVAAGYAIVTDAAADCAHITGNTVIGNGKALRGISVGASVTRALVSGNNISGTTQDCIIVSPNLAPIVVSDNHMAATSGNELNAGATVSKSKNYSVVAATYTP